MRPSNLLIIVTMALLSSCATASQEASADTSAPSQVLADSTTTNADVKDSATILKPKSGSYSPECYKAITDIIMSSSFKTDLAKKENIKVRIDRIEGSKLFLQLFASEKDHESTLAWLRLDKANEKLEDITVDPTKPIVLTYDTKLISELRQTCP
ncbi:hypothetical protein [Chitinophaga sancti]|uniref:hypothetical protein n=1 Tax=Chitinophaga sancti TaxID=1004 RepID=UPI003F7A7B3A